MQDENLSSMNISVFFFLCEVETLKYIVTIERSRILIVLQYFIVSRWFDISKFCPTKIMNSYKLTKKSIFILIVYISFANSFTDVHFNC